LTTNRLQKAGHIFKCFKSRLACLQCNHTRATCSASTTSLMYQLPLEWHKKITRLID